MWRKVSLRNRLNLLFAALLLAWLVVDVGRMLVDAGPRARAESESVTGLTSNFVTTALAHVQDSPEPTRDLAALVANLQNIRHIQVRAGRGRRPRRRIRVHSGDGRENSRMVSRDRERADQRLHDSRRRAAA